MYRAVVAVCRRFSSSLTNAASSNVIHRHIHPLEAPSATCLLRLKHTTANSAEPDNAASQTPGFTGYIPIEELEISYSRSSGPGGQNVNKVNTKVEVRFHIPSASWITPDIKNKLSEMQSTRITKDGFLVVTSDRTRKQMLNQADCMDKLRTMVFQAAAQPRGLTEEEIELRDKRIAKAKERTLREKRNNSLKRQGRGSL